MAAHGSGVRTTTLSSSASVHTLHVCVPNTRSLHETPAATSRIVPTRSIKPTPHPQLPPTASLHCHTPAQRSSVSPRWDHFSRRRSILRPRLLLWVPTVIACRGSASRVRSARPKTPRNRTLTSACTWKARGRTPPPPLTASSWRGSTSRTAGESVRDGWLNHARPVSFV